MADSLYDRDHGADSYLPQAWYTLVDKLSDQALREVRDLLGQEIIPTDDRDEMMAETASGEVVRRGLTSGDKTVT